MSTPDFIVEDHGTVVVFQPMTGAAREFARESVDVPEWAWVGDRSACAFAVHWGVADQLAESLAGNDGFIVEAAS